MVVGDRVLGTEAEFVMVREGIHYILAHKHWIEPWEVTEAVLPGFSYTVMTNGRGIRRRRMPAANIKMFHLHPNDLRYDFEDDFSHWGVDFGLAEPSTLWCCRCII